VTAFSSSALADVGMDIRREPLEQPRTAWSGALTGRLAQMFIFELDVHN
jgi:hypothetical protein